MSIRHASDCAVHNEPAYPNGPCDCGAITDQKIDISPAAVERAAVIIDEAASPHIAAMMRSMSTELDRLKAERTVAIELLARTRCPSLWAKIDQWIADDDWNGATALNAKTTYLKEAETALVAGKWSDDLKASRTFSDGVEAAAKWHEAEADRFGDAASYYEQDMGVDIQRHLSHAAAIRALSPQPRPDAQAQRERELALVFFARICEKDDGPEPITDEEILTAFDRSQS